MGPDLIDGMLHFTFRALVIPSVYSCCPASQPWPTSHLNSPLNEHLRVYSGLPRIPMSVLISSDTNHAFAKSSSFASALLSVLRSKLVAGVLAGLGTVLLLIAAMPAPKQPELLTIQKAPFQIEVQTRGSIEPLRTERVISQCQWTVRILSLIPEGTWVKKGDVVCVLDSSEIEEFQRSRDVTLIKAQAALQASRQQEELQKAAAERRLAEAERDLQSAELDLLEYGQGLYPNEVRQLEDDISFNHDQLRNAGGELQFAERLWMLGFANRADVDSESLEVTAKSEQLRRLEFRRNLLQEFTHPRRELQLTHHLKNSALNVHRTELANSLAASKAKLGTMLDEHRMAIYERYANTARESIKACTLRAPRDGQVIHANNWKMRSRGVITIEEGKSVYFSQPIFEIPDQDHLKISLPFNETLITRVAMGDRVMIRPVGFESLAVPARISRISPYPVALNRYAPDVKEYLLDAILEPDSVQRELLRPRMDAEATVTLFDRDDAIAVPPQAVTRCAGMNLVLIRRGDQLLPCQVETGEIVDGKVLIQSGLSEGDEIVANITDEQRLSLDKRLQGPTETGSSSALTAGL